MKLRNVCILSASFVFTALMLPSVVKAQSSNKDLSPDQLTAKIAHMDSLLFNAFNACDVTTSKSLFTEDLEFYHDAGGLTNYAQNVKLIVQRCEGETKVRRELVEGSLEVFPIKGFGAIQVGSHRFYHTAKGQNEQMDGTFKFVHIWKNVNGDWKICRVISYDH
jgi:ketosteroid isomerase-like protein